MTVEQILRWLKDNKDYLNIKSIEVRCGIPQGTLSRNLKEERFNLRSAKHQSELIRFYQEFMELPQIEKQ